MTIATRVITLLLMVPLGPLIGFGLINTVIPSTGWGSIVLCFVVIPGSLAYWIGSRSGSRGFAIAAAAASTLGSFIGVLAALINAGRNGAL